MDQETLPVEEEEEVSSVPSIRDSIESALSEAASREAVSDDAPAVEEEGPARGPDGKFAKREAPVEAAPEEIPEADKPPAVEAPASWSKEGRELFTGADPKLREYIMQRDRQQQEGVAKLKHEYEGKAKFAEEMWGEIAPYQQLIESEGGTPAGAVRELLQTAALMRQGTPQQKAQALYQIARQFNVPLSGEQPETPSDPRYDALQQELQSVRNEFGQFRQSAADQQTQALQAEVDAFKAEHPHFEAVRATMGRLIQSGEAEGLKDAYEKAVWLNPDIRESTLSEQEAAKEAERKAQERERTEKAKKAAGSVTGAPGLAGNPSRPAPKSIRGALEQAFEEART